MILPLKDGRIAKAVSVKGLHLLCQITDGAGEHAVLVGAEQAANKGLFREAYFACGGERVFTESGEEFDPFC